MQLFYAPHGRMEDEVHDPSGITHEAHYPDPPREVDLRNNWMEASDLEEAKLDAEYANSAKHLGWLLRWFASSEEPSSLMLKAAALVVACRPDLLPEGRRKQAEMAKWLGNYTRAAVGKYVRHLFVVGRGRFVHGMGCQSSDRREAARLSTLKVHARRKQQERKEP